MIHGPPSCRGVGTADRIHLPGRSREGWDGSVIKAVLPHGVMGDSRTDHLDGLRAVARCGIREPSPMARHGRLWRPSQARDPDVLQGRVPVVRDCGNRGDYTDCIDEVIGFPALADDLFRVGTVSSGLPPSRTRFKNITANRTDFRVEGHPPRRE